MNLDKIKCIFSTVRLLADNAHGGITGVHGSVNPRAVGLIAFCSSECNSGVIVGKSALS
jgi:hypothetical protein